MMKKAITAALAVVLAVPAYAAVMFSDVPASHPAAYDISYAVDRGWFSGYKDGTFKPGLDITPEQMATVMGRMFPRGISRAEFASFLRRGHEGRLPHTTYPVVTEPTTTRPPTTTTTTTMLAATTTSPPPPTTTTTSPPPTTTTSPPPPSTTTTTWPYPLTRLPLLSVEDEDGNTLLRWKYATSAYQTIKVCEDAGSITITAMLEFPRQDTARASWIVLDSDGSYRPGGDVVEATGMLAFEPGTTRTSVTIAIPDNDIRDHGINPAPYSRARWEFRVYGGVNLTIDGGSYQFYTEDDETPYSSGGRCAL